MIAKLFKGILKKDQQKRFIPRHPDHNTRVGKATAYTNMTLAAIASMRESLSDPAVRYAEVGQAVQGAIKEVVVHNMQVLGSAGKA